MSKKKQKSSELVAALLFFTALVCIGLGMARDTAKTPATRRLDEMSIDELKALLKQAVEIEDYKMAIVYRDKIRQRNDLKKSA